MACAVTALAIAPIKGTRLRAVDRVELGPSGVREDRRFYLIDARNRMINGKQLGELQAIVAHYDDVRRRLRIELPDGRAVEDDVALGETVESRFYSRPGTGRLVEGRFSAALSELAAQPLRLVEAGVQGAVDRGFRGAVSLISQASLDRFAQAAQRKCVDARRFRMLVEIAGVTPHEEDHWVGQPVAIGQAQVRFEGHVGRCLVTSRDPDDGEIDLPTLEILGTYRDGLATTAPLPFGVYGRVQRPGTIRVGDAVLPGA